MYWDKHARVNSEDPDLSDQCLFCHSSSNVLDKSTESRMDIQILEVW